MPVTADGTESTERVLQATLICPWQVDLHVASMSLFYLHGICVFKHDLIIFIWYQRQSESCLWEVGTASPGRCQVSLPAVGGLAARSAVAPALAKCCSVFPFQIYRSVCFLFFLFPANKNKSLSAPEKQATFLFPVLVSLAHNILCASDKDKKLVFFFFLSRLSSFKCCRSPPPPSHRPPPSLVPPVSLTVFDKVVLHSFSLSW